jgi:hypothetical protein
MVAGTHVHKSFDAVVSQGVRTSHQDFSGRVGDGASTFGGSVWHDNGHGKMLGDALYNPC